MRQSPRLVVGDLVAVVSPSSTPTEEHLRSLIVELESWGLRVTLGEHVSGTHGPFAGRDADRLDDLNAAFRDPEVRAVFASRGGAGAYRIVDGIDFDAVRADPKPVVGFSDITNLHVSLLAETGLATVHGCLGENRVADDVHSLLMGAEGLMISSDPTVLSAPIVVSGVASGRLVGGNLREFAGSVGAGLPDLAGAIVFLEDLRHVGIGQVDRNLTQLIRSGSFDGIAGVALGLFDGFEGYVDAGWSVLDVFADRLGGLGVPVLGGLKVGHGGVDAEGRPDQRALVLGAPARLDAVAGTLQVGACTI